MFSFGYDNFGDLTALLNRPGTELSTVLASKHLRNAFQKNNLKLLQFLFLHLLELLDTAMGLSDSDVPIPREVQQNAFFCFTTQAAQFTSQLTTCRPLLQRLNAYLSADVDLSNETITVLVCIIEFMIHASNGFVLMHFPDRNNFLRKLIKYIKYVSVYNFLHFISYSGLQILNDFMAQVNATQTLLNGLGSDPLVNERLFVLLSNLVCIAKMKSNLTAPYTKEEVVESVLKYCMDGKHEAVATSAFRLLTCFCNHFYEAGNDIALIKQLGRHVPEMCDYIQSTDRFTKSKSVDLLILIRIIAFSKDIDVKPIIDLLPYLLDKFIKEPQNTFVHSSFYELLKVSVIRDPSVVSTLKLKELIMELYKEKHEKLAVYWGFLHRITGLIVRWRGFEAYTVEGWNNFVNTVYNKEEQIYLSQYGGAMPRTGTTSFDADSFPSFKSDDSKPQLISKPTFDSVQVSQAASHKSDDEDYDYDEYDYESEVEPPEVQGEELKWMWSKLIPKERIKRTMSVNLESIFVGADITEKIALSPDGTMIALACAKDVEVFKRNMHQTIVMQESFKTRISAICFTKDSAKIIIVLENDPKIRVYQTSTGLLEKTMDFHNTASIVISNDCSKIATNDGASTKVYDFETLDMIASFEYEKHISTFSTFSANGNYIATAYFGGTICVYDIEKKIRKAHVKAHEKELTAIAVGNNGDKFITASVDTTVKIWSSTDESLQWRTLKGHKRVVNSVSLDKTENWVISGSEDTNVNISYLGSEEMVYSLGGHTGSVTSVMFDYDRMMFVTASDDLLVKVWKFEESACD